MDGVVSLPTDSSPSAVEMYGRSVLPAGANRAAPRVRSCLTLALRLPWRDGTRQLVYAYRLILEPAAGFFEDQS